MPDRSYLDWPFFEPDHREIAAAAANWAGGALREEHLLEGDALPDACRSLVRRMGVAGWLRHVVPGADGRLDTRALCLIREALAYRHGVLDFVFALQGLGSGPISLFGTDAQKQRYLPGVAAGERIAAFAITESSSDAGSDIAAMRSIARRAADGWVLEGTKTWISNATIADHYVIFCRLPDEGERAFGAFVVDRDVEGLSAARNLEIMAPHVLGTLELRDCRVGPDAMIGGPRDGLRIALATLDVFRPTVGAAALGMARKALDSALASLEGRNAFGHWLGHHQMTQSRIADMAVDIDAAALLVYRAAWAHDRSGERPTREASMAKLHATEAAQRVVDAAIQLCGARGVQRGHPLERLYREVRALRIYEGTSEIQRIIIAERVLAEAAPAGRA